jgi:hypothetical protein
MKEQASRALIVRRLVVLVFAATLPLLTGGLAGVVSEADLVGLWRVKPESYVVNPNQGNSSGIGRIVRTDGTELIFEGRPIVAVLPETMPTNYASFALIVEHNGDFVATNVPAGFIGDMPIGETRGTWELDTRAHPHNSNSFDQSFSLYFRQSSSNHERTFRTDRSKKEPYLHIWVGKHREIALVKQFELTTSASLISQSWLKENDDPRLQGTWRPTQEVVFQIDGKTTSRYLTGTDRILNTITYSNCVRSIDRGGKVFDHGGKVWSSRYRVVERGSDFVTVRSRGLDKRIRFVDGNAAFWIDDAPEIKLQLRYEKMQK